MKETVIFLAILVPIIYVVTKFLFDLFLRGFVPFITSRPWVVEQVLRELKFDKKDLKMVAFSTGRSGIFHALEKKYPEAEMIGIEPTLFPFIVSKVQTWIRKTKIKVIYMPIHRAHIKDVDFIYSHLRPDVMRGIDRKMKFECKTGCTILSTGFNYAALNAKKIIPLPDRKGRFDWLAKNQKLFTRKSKIFKKEKKAFIYVIE